MAYPASISGHGISTDGTNDPGAVYGNRVERDIVKVITEYENAFYRMCGVDYLTDLDHGNVNMVASVDLANEAGCDTYKSNHANSASGNPEGALAIVISEEGARMAENIRASVQLRLPIKWLGLIWRDDYEVAYTDAPACIWECGFLQSDHDSDLMINHAKAYGEAIAMGRMDYYGLTQVYIDKMNELNKPTDTVAPTAAEITNNGPVSYGETYEVYAHGVKDDGSGVASVQFPTWTLANDQDDLVWHEGENCGNGVWKCVINKKEHNGENGVYVTHVYATDKAGNMQQIGATAVEFKPFDKKAKGTVITPSPSTFEESYTVMATISEKGDTEIAKMLFPTWTEENGQDDIIWHEGTRMEASDAEAWECTIKRGDHGGQYGNYQTDVWAEDKYGHQWFLGTAKVKMLSEQARIEGIEKVLADHEKRIADLEV